MTAARESFLERIREAVRAGNQAGTKIPLPDRGTIGYQGAGSDPVERFHRELATAGGQFYQVDAPPAAAATVLQIVQALGARRILLGLGALIESSRLADQLRAAGIEVTSVDSLDAQDRRDPMFAADIGISCAETLIAETGTVVLSARPAEPRSLSLLPPVHIVLAERAQLMADLFDLFDDGNAGEIPQPPSCLSLITGPSKTGDIELRLVTGVHGPGEVHVILVG
jgi:L-lactate dehydrogenase complex protein LldG